MPTTYHKRKRRKWHILKRTIVGLLTILEGHLEHRHQKERVQEFICWLRRLYE